MVRVSRKTKNLIYRILTIILTMALAAGAIFGIYKLVEKSKEKTKTLHLSYSIGALDVNGKYIESENSLYTKDAFECQGLNTELCFDNNISYEVFFYDSLGDFISSSGVQFGNYKNVPVFASRARIVITPNATDDEEVKVNWFNKSKYAKQLTVTVNKDQTSKFENVVLVFEDQTKLFTNFEGELSSSDSQTYMTTTAISVKGYSRICLFKNDSGVKSIYYYFGDSAGKSVGSRNTFSFPDGESQFFIDIPKGVEFVRFANRTGGYSVYLIK